MKKLLILGAGGYAQQLHFIVQRGGQYEVVGFVDETINSEGKLCDVPVRRNPEEFDFHKNEIELICAVGSIPTRKRWFETYSREYNFTSIIDPSVIMAPDVTVGTNVVILGNTVCSSECTIADNVNINWFCLVTHHVSVGAFTNFASGVRATGHVKIAEEVDIGTNAVIIPRVTVGRGAVIGAGAVVLRDVEPGATVVGVPAKPK